MIENRVLICVNNNHAVIASPDVINTLPMKKKEEHYVQYYAKNDFVQQLAFFNKNSKNLNPRNMHISDICTVNMSNNNNKLKCWYSFRIIRKTKSNKHTYP